jgi:molybdate transport system ATP-binding protein
MNPSLNIHIDQCGPEPLHGLKCSTSLGQPLVIFGGQSTGKSILTRWISEPKTTTHGFFLSGSTNIQTLSVAMETDLLDQARHNDDSEFIEGGFDPGKTTEELIQSESSDPDQVETWINRFQLDPQRKTPFKYLSNGEIRKTLLAKALATDPDILVCDTPFEGLDTSITTLIKEQLHNWTRSGALILCLHKISDWPEWIQQGIWLRHGHPPQNLSRPDFLKVHQRASDLEFTDSLFCEAPQQPKECDPNSNKKPDSNNTPLLTLNHINIRWGERDIFKGFNWTIHRGEHWRVTGPNGVGKTTLLQLLYADHPQSTRQDIRGFGLQRGHGESVWDWRKYMGLVTPNLQRNFLKGEKGLGIVVSGLFDSVGLYQRPEASDIKKAKDWLEQFQLQHLGQKFSDEMSYSELRLLLIARALIKMPRLLILDEPCQGLDDQQRENMLRLLSRVAQTHRSQIVLTSHDPSETIPEIRHHLSLSPSPEGAISSEQHNL